MKNLKLKSVLLALSFGFGLSGIAAAAPNAESCLNFEIACEEGDQSACRIFYRYC